MDLIRDGFDRNSCYLSSLVNAEYFGNNTYIESIPKFYKLNYKLGYDNWESHNLSFKILVSVIFLEN